MTGLIVFAHGSTIESANDAVHSVTAELARRTGCRDGDGISRLRAAHDGGRSSRLATRWMSTGSLYSRIF